MSSRRAPFKANPRMLSQLRGMGFAEQTCHRALEVAQNSRDRAVEWAIAHNVREREMHPRCREACARLLHDDPTLEELNLGAIALNGEGIRMLAEALPHSTHLRALFIYDTNMDPVSIAILCAGLKKNRGVVSLNLGENPNLGYDGAESLIDLLEHKPDLYQLYLDWGVTNAAQKRVISQLLALNHRRTPIRYKDHHSGFRGADLLKKLNGAAIVKCNGHKRKAGDAGAAGNGKRARGSRRRHGSRA